MKKLTTLISLALLLILVATNVNAERYTLNIGDFTKLKVHDNVNVVYSNNPDSIGYAFFEGESRFADAFIITPKNETLKIQVSTEDVGSPELPTLHVYSKFLHEVENSSDFTVYINDLAPTTEIKAKLIGNGKIIINNIDATKVSSNLSTGNGTIILKGVCSTASLKMVGTGTIQADGLKANQVNCSIFGTGTIGCWATETLKSKGVGSTKIYYKGNPETIKKSGGGHLYKMDDDGNIISE